LRRTEARAQRTLDATPSKKASVWECWGASPPCAPETQGAIPLADDKGAALGVHLDQTPKLWNLTTVAHWAAARPLIYHAFRMFPMTTAMKTVVINYTGTVGKTTVSANLLAPRMADAKIFAIESINETAQDLGLDVNKMRGDRFRELLQSIVLEDNAIIDVGASNVEDFMDNLQGFEGAHEEIDFFIVPVTSGTKEQKETISMINSLSAIGVPADKIRVVFNRVIRDVAEEFSMIVNYHEATKLFWLDFTCAIYETELFDALSVNKLTMEMLMADENDYKELLKNKDADPDDRQNWSDMFGLKLLCKGVNRKLDAVFLRLFA
jgi:hypothetical protein